MKPLSFMLKATSIAVLTVFSTGSLGHAEHDKPRYVSPLGVDSGDCDSVEAPCLSVSYAAGRSNKGDQILVAGGDYQLNDADSLFYLLSDVVEVKAGYSTKDKYQVRNSADNLTTLSGVPLEFAAQLREKGFAVLSDLASLSKSTRAELDSKLAEYRVLSERQSNEACVEGKAGAFSCDKVDLLSHVPIADFELGNADGSDIWGYVDLNTGREYAIMGFSRGYSVIDVTEPTQPNIIGSIPAQRTLWRDIKVNQFYDTEAERWKAYAYVTADNASVGLTIVDLNDLANGISIANIDKTDIRAHNVFISNVDYSTGVALTGMEAIVHLAGANNASGAFNSYTIKTEDASVEAKYRPSGASGYSHDVSAHVVTDERVNTQCQGKNGACEIFFDYNEEEVRIWNKTNNTLPQQLSTITYAGARYVHSGWTSEDGKYVFVHDELDEGGNAENTKVRVFDISDLGNPKPAATWEGPSSAIDHNGFVRGNRYYMSNYERGLQILDITDPTNPTAVGFFDTYGVSDNASFNGAWGVYPFLPSGNIIVSDINSGLYVLADKTVGTAEFDSVKFNTTSYEMDEGGSITVNVERVGDPSKAVSVDYETHVGSAGTDDFTMVNGTLSWAAGDTEDKQIVLNASEDFVDGEQSELFFLRMYNPVGGLSLAAPNLVTVNVKGKAVPPYASFAAGDVEVKEVDGTVSVPVTRRGDITQGLTVEFEVIGGSATSGEDFQVSNGVSAGSLVWAAGESSSKTIDITLTDDSESESVEDIVLKLTQTTSADAVEQVTLMVRDDDSNQPATLSVTEDMTVTGGDTVNLAAVASDPEGYPLTYKWTQTAGTVVTVEDFTASNISFATPSDATEIVFELVVTDDFGVTTTESVKVTVEAKTTTTPTEPTQPTQPTQPSSSGGGAASMFVLSLLGLMGFRRRRQF